MGKTKTVPRDRGEVVNGYLMFEVTKQRNAERREDARKKSLARALRKTMRQRNRAAAVDTVVLPPIPDYVDGTFGEAGSQVPADRATC
jgi:hypothetical protein